MISVVEGVFLVFLCLLLRQHYRGGRRLKLVSEALDGWWVLHDCIWDRFDNDPAMNYAKWRELLPICRFADERRRDCCFGSDFSSLAVPYRSLESLVLGFMSEEEISV